MRDIANQLNALIESAQIDEFQFLLVAKWGDIGKRIENVRYDKGDTLLHIAANSKNLSAENKIKLLTIMLSMGADVDGRNGLGQTALYFATLSRNCDVMSFLLGAKADPNLEMGFIHPENGRIIKARLMHFAAKQNDANLIKILHQAGADLEVLDDAGFYPIHYAVGSQSLNVVKTLVECGAKVNSKVSNLQLFNGSTALSLCLVSCNVEILKLLLDLPRVEVDLAHAVGHLEIANRSDDSDRVYTRLQMLYLLLERGGVNPFVTINSINHAGAIVPMSIRVAECSKSSYLKQMLHDYEKYYIAGGMEGGEQYQCMSTLVNAFMRIAIEKDNIDSFKAAISRGAEIHFVDCIDKLSGIAFAVLCNSKNILKEVLSNGQVGLDYIDASNGFSLMHYAAYYDSEDIVRLLRDMRIDAITKIHSTGMTPLHMAISNNKIKATKALLEHEPALLLSQQDNAARTPESYCKTAEMMLLIAAVNKNLINILPVEKESNANPGGLSMQLASSTAQPEPVWINQPMFSMNLDQSQEFVQQQIGFSGDLNSTPETSIIKQ